MTVFLTVIAIFNFILATVFLVRWVDCVNHARLIHDIDLSNISMLLYAERVEDAKDYANIASSRIITDPLKCQSLPEFISLVKEKNDHNCM